MPVLRDILAASDDEIPVDRPERSRKAVALGDRLIVDQAKIGDW